MPSWNELLTEFGRLTNVKEKSEWVSTKLAESLRAIGAERGDRNVIFYASAFLQKPGTPAPWLQLSHEDLNGFMSVVHGMDCRKGLTLLLHTPGGITNAAECIVAYLWSKFTDIEVVVPTFAMSAGTMIALGANRLVMGRQSQLGPIDPQLPLEGRSISAQAVVEQFELARKEVLKDLDAAHVWAPVLQSVGPALLVEAQNTLAYGEQMVAQWLAEHMYADEEDSVERGKRTAAHFNDASRHKSHGRRISREEARQQNVLVEDLEDNQAVQDHVLTAYHLMTLTFEQSPATKLLTSGAGRSWIKNVISNPALRVPGVPGSGPGA